MPLADQRVRLLSENPWDATDLAQVLYSMLLDDTTPMQAGSAVSLTYNGVAPIQVTGLQQDPTTPVPILQIKKGNGSSVSLSFYTGGFVIQETTPQGETTTTPLAVGGGGKSAPGGKIYPGQVQSGSGTDYVVAVFTKGPNGTSIQVNATQLQIDPGDTIPQNTWCWVSANADGSYSMLVPTFV